MSQDGDLQQSCTSKKQMSASTPTLEKVLPPFERRSDGRPPLPTVFKHRPGGNRIFKFKFYKKISAIKRWLTTFLVVNEVENNGIGSNGKEQRLPRSKSIEAGLANCWKVFLCLMTQFSGHDSSIRGHNTQIVWDSEVSRFPFFSCCNLKK